MKENKFNQYRILITMYVSTMVAVAVSLENKGLAAVAIVTGIICLWLVKKRLAVKTTDERTEHIASRAATMTYSTTSSAFAIVSMILIFFPGDQPYLQSIGVIMSYVTLVMIGLYAILYRYFLSQES